MTDLSAYSEQLVVEYGLPPETGGRLLELAERCVSLEISGTAIPSADEALRLHVADSLAGLEVEAIERAETLCDIGTGVGFPGLVLAVARPELRVTLVDSVRKKVETAASIARAAGIENAECIWSRAELLGASGSSSRESFDVVTARALAPLTALVEYAGPLLSVGGSLVAWKGLPDEKELADAAAAEDELGFERGRLVETRPFSESRSRHFYVTRKARPCGQRYPRREGVALRKPIVAG